MLEIYFGVYFDFQYCYRYITDYGHMMTRFHIILQGDKSIRSYCKKTYNFTFFTQNLISFNHFSTP